MPQRRYSSISQKGSELAGGVWVDKLPPAQPPPQPVHLYFTVSSRVPWPPSL